MYTLVYNYRETKNSELSIEREYYYNEVFRTRKSAVHYLHDKIQNFKGYGYRTQEMSSGTIHCYRSDLTTKNELKVIEWTISIKKS